jgi:hypothetical protein
LLDTDGFPINVEFVSDDHGEMCFDALTYLGILRHDGYSAIHGDADECGWRESDGRWLCRLSKNFRDRIGVQRDQNATPSDRRDTKKSAAIKNHSDHGTSLLLSSLPTGR